MKQYEFDNQIYSVVTCTENDIPSHVERVLSYWANADIKEQIQALEQAVASKTAWKLVDENSETKSVVYCNMLNKRDAMSNLLWLADKRMFAMLCYYLRLTANIQHIYFLPHSNHIPFRFIVQESSIRLFHSHGTPLEIDLYSKKSQKLYEVHFLRHNIREL